MKTITVDKKDEGNRIDLYLMEVMPSITRTTIKKLVIDGLVTVKGTVVRPENRIMPNYHIRAGDEISIDANGIKGFMSHGDNKTNEIKPKDFKLEILYEDENIIVVNKPSGLQSHPVLRNDTNSVLNGLFYHVQNNSKFDKNVKVRLIHRLDKETSGVLLAAKNLTAQDYYSKLFESRDVTKEYLAIVQGDFKSMLERREIENLIIRSFINKSTGKEKKYINTSPGKGKPAFSTVYFERYFNKFGKRKFSLVRIVPETGRTHQIRVHLSARGFPILGDTLYGGQKYKRIMLHAHKLTLKLMGTEEEKTFIAELPEKFIDRPDKKVENLDRS